MAGEQTKGIIIFLAIVVCVIAVVSVMNPNLFFQDDQGEEAAQEEGLELPQYQFNEDITCVVDGDTIELANGDRVRLLGINSEEDGHPHAETATNKLRELLSSGKITLEEDEDKEDRYGRLLRYVYADGVFVNLEIVRQGYAHVYIIEPNVKYTAELLAAEKEAQRNESGIWQPSPYDVIVTEVHPEQGDGPDGLNSEYVIFKNNGSASIMLTNWTVKDESTHYFTFPDSVLEPGAEVVLRTGVGENTDSDIYWNSSDPRWNNDGDDVYLRDQNGLLVDYYEY